MPPVADKNSLTVKLIDEELRVSEVDHPAWETGEAVQVTRYWSGAEASPARWFTARLLWSNTALYVKFVAPHAEPQIVSQQPDTSRKTLGLWDRDVLEIFIAPDRTRPEKYFEFEIAPTGEWVDLAIEITSEGRITDAEYRSGMESFAKEKNGTTHAVIKVPFTSIGGTPKIGDVWLGNLFRCIGQGPDRGYLAWRPTRTERPDFHVPAAFGEFRFVK